jgi:starch phosphorylase
MERSFDPLASLFQLALDLRWTWSHGADALWRHLDAERWAATHNPWHLLHDIPPEQLNAAVRDPQVNEEIRALTEIRARDQDTPCWCQFAFAGALPRLVAYFSKEFGLGEALPLYAGGLGVLAGDTLKGASDLGLPMVGVGLLYQEGYFRQAMTADGSQLELYPYNEPANLPIQRVLDPDGGRLHVPVEFAGRTIRLRVWRANVGRVPLYLLDSNDPLNSPADRGITAKLYGHGPEVRLMQEILLGVGGWHILQMLGIEGDVCHLNEGHAAFAGLERARQWMRERGVPFDEALAATRAGNVFTTHTPVEAGFDRYEPDLVSRYLLDDLASEARCLTEELLALGRRDGSAAGEPFNMTYLAMRTSIAANGVSYLHGAVSRRLFQPLFPRWPEQEVPVGHVTNGVHVPSWDSPWSDRIWTEACGKARWRGAVGELGSTIETLPDEVLWSFRTKERQDLIEYARSRLSRPTNAIRRGAIDIARVGDILQPHALTLGFARRFTGYKRPNLLLHDPSRLARLLQDPARPVQIVVAGKAHPADEEGKRLIREWIGFSRSPDVLGKVLFLEDYDMSLAQQLVQGIDVWINTPRRPWEASGTSGMKVLVNGGLNLLSRRLSHRRPKRPLARPHTARKSCAWTARPTWSSSGNGRWWRRSRSSAVPGGGRRAHRKTP